MKRIYSIATNIVSPLGFTADATFKRVLDGETGLRSQAFSFSPLPCWVSVIEEAQLDEAFAKLADPQGFTKLEKMSVLSLAEAREQANVDLDDPGTLLLYCTTKGDIDKLANNVPGSHEGTLLHKLAGRVSRFFHLANEPLVVSNACISGLQGVMIAQRMLKAGLYKQVIVLGGDMVSKFTLSGFQSFSALSNEPCRPFDADRKGINLGEAAATMILSAEPPKKGEMVEVVAGYSSNDANHISAPSRTGEGLYQVITKTLGQADPETIGFIGAHGTATPYNDEMEAQAFYRAGLHTRPLHSLKGYFGHTLGAAGLLESIIGIKSLLANELVPSRGYQTCGTTYQLQPIRQAAHRQMTAFLKTSSGFGGCNASVLFSKIQ